MKFQCEGETQTLTLLEARKRFVSPGYRETAAGRLELDFANFPKGDPFFVKERSTNRIRSVRKVQ